MHQKQPPAKVAVAVSELVPIVIAEVSDAVEASNAAFSEELTESDSSATKLLALVQPNITQLNSNAVKPTKILRTIVLPGRCWLNAVIGE
ncbi:MAG: hypothetical protein WA783_06800 [Phormidesmis sp.]